MNKLLFEELKEKNYEDFIKTLEVKSTIENTNFGFQTTLMLAEGFAKIESLELAVKEVIMNPRTYAHFRALGRDIIDVETDLKKVKQGIMAHVWGATFFTELKMPNHIVLICSEQKHRIAVKLTENPEQVTQKLIESYSELNTLLHKALHKQKDIANIIYDMTKKVK